MFRKQTVIAVLIILLSTVGYVMAYQGFRSDKPQTPAADTEDPNARFPSVRPLDDPENPYSDQYRAWDLWFRENMVSQIDYDLHSMDPEVVSMESILDTDGFQVPLVELERQAEQAMAVGQGGKQYFETWEGHQIFAQGYPPDGMVAAKEAAVWEAKAGFYPEIPEFLGENPPFRTLLLEPDLFVTMGEPGTGETADRIPDPGQAPAEALSYYAFDSMGNLLGSTPGPWWHLTYGEWEGIYDQLAHEGWGQDSGFDAHIFDPNRMGYIGFRNSDTGEVLAIYDYDGTFVGTDYQAVQRDEHPYAYISANILRQLYLAQTSQ